MHVQPIFSKHLTTALALTVLLFTVYVIGFLALLLFHSSFTLFIYYIFGGFGILIILWLLVVLWSIKKFLHAGHEKNSATYKSIYIIGILALIAGVVLGFVAMGKRERIPTISFSDPKKPGSTARGTPVPSSTESPGTSPRTTTEQRTDEYIFNVTLLRNTSDDKRENEAAHLVLPLLHGYSTSTDSRNNSIYKGNASFEIQAYPPTGIYSAEGEMSTYTDKSFPPAKILRIWQDNEGVYLLNPQGIFNDGFSMNNFTIRKTAPTKRFTEVEIQEWETMIQSLYIRLI